MDIALMLHHGVRKDAPSEVTQSPHMELVASTVMERQKLKVLAEQLKTFGSIPFAYHEVESINQSQQGAIMRISLCERPASGTP